MRDRQLGIRVDNDTYKELSKLAESEDRSVAQVIRHAIEHWLVIKRVRAS